MKIKEMLKMNILIKTVKRFKEVRRRNRLNTYRASIQLPSGDEFYIETKGEDEYEVLKSIEDYIYEDNRLIEIKKL